MTIMQQNTPHNSRSTKLDMLKNPLLVAFILIVLLLAAGEALSPGFASMEQILRLLIVAALLGIVAAGQNLVILGGTRGDRPFCGRGRIPERRFGRQCDGR